MAAAPEPANRPPIPDATEPEIDLLIAEAGGDPRQAIRNLLHDLTVLALDAEASISLGFMRGRMPGRPRKLP